jgi:hypothetical protein
MDLLMKKLDVTRDGVLDQGEFHCAVIDTDLLLLESMGPVLPSRQARWAFLNTFTDQLGQF